MHMNSTKLYHYVPQYVHTLPCLFQCLAHGDSLLRSVLCKNMIMMLLSISGNVALNPGPQDVPTTKTRYFIESNKFVEISTYMNSKN